MHKLYLTLPFLFQGWGLSRWDQIHRRLLLSTGPILTVLFEMQKSKALSEHEKKWMVTVQKDCPTCGVKSFQWRSQPLILGKYLAGNVLLSFAILMASACVTKVLLLFRHLGLSAVCFSKPRSSMGWRWQIWFNGSLCKLWILHNVLIIHFESGALWTYPGKDIILLIVSACCPQHHNSYKIQDIYIECTSAQILTP